MKLFKLLTPLFALMSTLAFAELPVETHGNLEKLIPEVVTMLEAKKYTEVLDTVVQPGQLAKVAEKAGGIEKFAEKFGEEKAGSLLTVLKSLKDIKPEMSEKDTKATYKLAEDAPTPKKSLIFLKVKDRWYLQN